MTSYDSTSNAEGEHRPSADSDRRTIALVGLMGVGKTSVGQRLAAALNMPFSDADDEIEAAAGLKITEIFEQFGEPYFREGERRVIARLMEGEPRVLATGGGAFMEPSTRALIKERAISVWLRADIDVIFRRVSRRDTRPLLRVDDPRAVIQKLMNERDPIYATADLTVESKDGPHERTVEAILAALKTWQGAHQAPRSDGT